MGVSGTPWSGQDVNWNCKTVRDLFSCIRERERGERERGREREREREREGEREEVER